MQACVVLNTGYTNAYFFLQASSLANHFEKSALQMIECEEGLQDI